MKKEILSLVKRLKSDDGTTKYLFEVPVQRSLVSDLPSGSTERIESAFIELPDREFGKPKYILCLSTMVGCIFQCGHCRNQFGGFYRNLRFDEINEQIKKVLSEDGNLEKVQREGIVEHAFMGMGEPLFGVGVIKAIQNHQPSVPDTRFAITTVGAKGYIDRLTNSKLHFPVRLEVSLHFSNDNLRRQWIHPNTLSTYRPDLTIKTTLDEAERFLQKNPGRVTLNYALIDGINNAEQDAAEIAGLLIGRNEFYVKVMEANQTSALTGSWRKERYPFGLDTDNRGPYYETPEEFRDVLRKYGVEATVFKSKGKDIRAGCGMMALS